MFAFLMSNHDCSAQRFIIKYNIYETLSQNYLLNSEIYFDAHNTISLGGGYLYQPQIVKVSYGKFGCRGANGLLEYRRYIDFIDRDNAGSYSKIKGFYIGGYGRIFNFIYTYDSLTLSNTYATKTSEDRTLYSFGIEAGYHAMYHKISFEFIIGYCLLYQYNYVQNFTNNAPFIQPPDNISRWAKHHIGVSVGYVFTERKKKHKKIDIIKQPEPEK